MKHNEELIPTVVIDTATGLPYVTMADDVGHFAGVEPTRDEIIQAFIADGEQFPSNEDRLHAFADVVVNTALIHEADYKTASEGFISEMGLLGAAFTVVNKDERTAAKALGLSPWADFWNKIRRKR